MFPIGEVVAHRDLGRSDEIAGAAVDLVRVAHSHARVVEPDRLRRALKGELAEVRTHREAVNGGRTDQIAADAVARQHREEEVAHKPSAREADARRGAEITSDRHLDPATAGADSSRDRIGARPNAERALRRSARRGVCAKGSADLERVRSFARRLGRSGQERGGQEDAQCDGDEQDAAMKRYR